ncbi:MAG: hypothetical protein P4L51_20570 [Puia sp.]|nr:hypothetical protein [Puia sp.]
MSRAKTTLLVACSLVAGGLIGAGIMQYRLKQNELIARTFRGYRISRSTLETLDQLEQSNVEEVKKRLEGQLASSIVEAEFLATRNDKAGEIAKQTLKVVSTYRVRPSFLQQEAGVREMLKKAGATPQ